MVGMKFKPGCIQLTSHLAMVSLKVEHGVLQLSSHIAMVSMKDEPGVMPRSHIHGSPRRFYYGLNLTDDPGNANFRSPMLTHYIRMIEYYYV